MKISMKLVYQYMAICFNFSLTSNHFHSLQVKNWDSNSRLVVDEDDNGKFRLERVKYIFRTTDHKPSLSSVYHMKLIGISFHDNYLVCGIMKKIGRRVI